MSSSDTPKRLDKLEKYLDELQMFGIKLGLEQTAELFRRCGAPLENRYIHLAGTNGKGSCGAMLECALRNSGFKTGFYTSPHLVDLRERFRINGRAVDTETLLRNGEKLILHTGAMKAEGKCPTFFEFTTALAALIFAEAKTDFVIWETGMGGRCDSTSVVTPELSLITNIALDHQQYLGDTIEKIAFEKAGIIKANRPVFTGVMPGEALEVIRSKAEKEKATLRLAAPEIADKVAFGHDERGLYQEFEWQNRKIRLHLAGAMQRRNFRAVFPVLEYLSGKYGLNLDKALDALALAKWPGRCQELLPGLIIDGGHNPDGAAALIEAVTETFPGEKFTVIFAGFKDKDVTENLRTLASVAAGFVFTPIDDPRPSYSAAELKSMVGNMAGNIPVIECSNTAEALKRAAELPGRTLAAGSLYLAGEILKQTSPEAAFDLT